MREAFGANRFAQMRDRRRVAEKILKAHKFEFNGRMRLSVSWFSEFWGRFVEFQAAKGLKDASKSTLPAGIKVLQTYSP